MKKAMTKAHGQTRKAPQKKKRVQPEEETPAIFLKHLTKSFLITLAIGVGLLLAVSLIAYFCPDPDSLILPLSLAASGLTALVGGFISLRLHGHSALLCGLCNGGACSVLMMLVSLFLGGYAHGYSALISGLLHAGFLLLSVTGAFLGRPHQKKR